MSAALEAESGAQALARSARSGTAARGEQDGLAREGGAPRGRRGSGSRAAVYQADGALAAPSWQTLAISRGQVLVIVATVVLIAAPVQVVVMVASNVLADWLRQSRLECNNVMSDGGGFHLSAHAGLAGWLSCVGVVSLGLLVSPRMRRMIPFVLLGGPLFLSLLLLVFAVDPPQTRAGRLFVSIGGTALACFIPDLAYIVWRVVTGKKTLGAALVGLVVSVTTSTIITALGWTLATYPLISKGVGLELGATVLVAINAALYPGLVCVWKMLVVGILRARVVRERLDYIGQIVLVLQLVATAPQAYVAFGFEGAGFVVQLATSAMIELGLIVLTARTAAVRDKLRHSIIRTSVGLANSVATFQYDSRHLGRSIVSGDTEKTPRRIILAIYAAYAAPGELLGILGGAAIVTIELGFSVSLLAQVFAMLLCELVTDELGVVVYSYHQIWVRRVRVQLPRRVYLAVVVAVVCSLQIVRTGVFLLCDLMQG